MDKRLPWMQFWVGDWISDPDVGAAEPATRGIWFDLLCHMHLKTTYELKGTVEQLARRGRCSPDAMKSCIADMEYHDIADISRDGEFVRIISRRLSREAEKRNGAKARKKTQRDRSVTPDVTPEIGESHTSEKRREEQRREEKNKKKRSRVFSASQEQLEKIYDIYPRKEGKKDGLAKLKKTIADPETYERVLGAVSNYAAKCRAERIVEQYQKHFSTWVNCWEDYVSYRPVAVVTDPNRSPFEPMPALLVGGKEEL